MRRGCNIVMDSWALTVLAQASMCAGSEYRSPVSWSLFLWILAGNVVTSAKRQPWSPECFGFIVVPWVSIFNNVRGSSWLAGQSFIAPLCCWYMRGKLQNVLPADFPSIIIISMLSLYLKFPGKIWLSFFFFSVFQCCSDDSDSSDQWGSTPK